MLPSWLQTGPYDGSMFVVAMTVATAGRVRRCRIVLMAKRVPRAALYVKPLAGFDQWA